MHRALSTAVIVTALMGGGTWATAQGVDSAEEYEARALTQWLGAAHLEELLVSVLEQQVRKQGSADQAITAQRLADGYLALIKKASDEAQLAILRPRILGFVAQEGKEHEVGLRLALSRADYKIALHAIERIRQGDLDAEATAAASASLARAREPLSHFIQLLEHRIDESRKRASGADEPQRRLLMEEVDSSVAQLLEGRFLRAWCEYWALWIALRPGGTPSAQQGQKAQMDVVRLWAQLLETGVPYPNPEHASVDLRGEEYYAQSILAMALTKALSGTMEVADPWFELLDEQGIWSGLKNHASWYLQALVDTRNYSRATQYMVDHAEQLGADQAVGAAVRAVVESQGSEAAVEMAAQASALAAQGADLGALRRIARRVPSLASSDSFAGCLSRGIEAYEAGRSDPNARDAQEHFDKAIVDLARAQSLATGRQETMAVCSGLHAWALMGAKRPCDACEVFLQSAQLRTGAQAEDAHWQAVRAALLGNCTGGRPGAPSRAMELAASYLAAFPDGVHAPDAMAAFAASPDAFKDDEFVRLVYRNAMRDQATPQQREAAATLCYRRFRGAVGGNRREEAARLLGIPLRSPQNWSAGTIDTVVRQQIEAALDREVRRADLAAVLLGQVEERFPRGEEPRELRAELALRHLMLALIESRAADAIAAMEQVRATGDKAWRPIAEATLIEGAQELLKGAQLDPILIQQLLLCVVEGKRQVLVSARQSADPLKADIAAMELGEALVSTAAAIRAAPAGAEWAARSTALAKEAQAIAQDVLAHRPDDPRALGLKADAAVEGKDAQAATDALIRLVGGLPQGSAEWFSRKVQLCEVLAQSNPAQAKAVLEQHAVLYPGWGEGVAGQRLRAIAKQLGVQSASEATAQPRGGAK